MKKIFILFLVHALFLIAGQVYAQEIQKPGERSINFSGSIDLYEFMKNSQNSEKAVKGSNLYENFEGDFPPAGWEVIVGSPAPSYQNWVKLSALTEWGEGTGGAQEGNHFANFSCYINNAGGTGYLVTPTMVPTVDDLTFSFWWNYFHVMGSFGNSGELYVDVFNQGTWYSGTTNIVDGQHGEGWFQEVIDLSDYLGQDFTDESIRIRFRGISDYGSYDIAIDKVKGPASGSSPTNLVVTGLNKDYTKIPQSQLINNISLLASITNTGDDLNEDVTVNFEVSDDNSTSIFSSTGTISAPLENMQSVEVSASTSWDATSLEIGDYTIEYEADHAVSDPNDKTDEISFEVSDYIYARDIGIQSYIGVGSSDSPITFGTIYEINQETMMTGVQIHWPNIFDELVFNVALYEVDNDNNVISTVFTSGDLVRNSDMSQQVIDHQTRPTIIPAGRYMLAVKQLTEESIRMGVDQVSHGVMYIANDASNPTSFNPQTDLGNITLRMNLEPRGIVTFAITEEGTSNEIENATVVVKQDATVVFTGTTDSEGEVEAWLTYNDNYTYSVTVPGYEPIDDADLTVTANHTINVSMEPSDPEFAITPDEKDFGTIIIGNSSEQIFALENIGGGTVEITNIELSGDADFTFSGQTTASLIVGEIHEIVVTFAPTEEIAKTATLTITHDADIEPVAVTLNGEGYDATIIITETWTETFEDDSETREYWTQIHEEGSVDWIFETGDGAFITDANSGTLNARFFGESWTEQITKLVTPPFDLSALPNPVLEFYYAQQVWEGDQNELKVYYREFGGEWIEIAHYTDNIPSWTKETLNIPNTAAQIAFEGIDYYGYANVIDDVTIRAEDTNDDASLADLRVDGETIEGFNSDVLEYAIELPYNTTDTPIVSADANDENANVDITQATELPGTATIVVTAEDDVTQLTYTVEFTLTDPNDDATLADLRVDGETIEGFNPDMFEYTIELPYNTTDTPIVSADANDENADVDITQATELPGTATILVMAEDGETQLTYSVDFTIATSIAEISSYLNVFPNPARSKFTIESNQAIRQVKLIHISGKVVKDIVLDATTNIEINVNNLNTGIYFIQIHTTESVQTKQVQVMR